MMPLLLNLLAAAIVLVTGLWHANNMTEHTRHGIRLAWVILTAGALAILLSPLYGYTHPIWSEVFFNMGVALFVVTNKRRGIV